MSQDPQALWKATGALGDLPKTIKELEDWLRRLHASCPFSLPLSDADRFAITFRLQRGFTTQQINDAAQAALSNLNLATPDRNSTDAGHSSNHQPHPSTTIAVNTTQATTPARSSTLGSNIPTSIRELENWLQASHDQLPFKSPVDEVEIREVLGALNYTLPRSDVAACLRRIVSRPATSPASPSFFQRGLLTFKKAFQTRASNKRDLDDDEDPVTRPKRRATESHAPGTSLHSTDYEALAEAQAKQLEAKASELEALRKKLAFRDEELRTEREQWLREDAKMALKLGAAERFSRKLGERIREYKDEANSDKAELRYLRKRVDNCEGCATRDIELSTLYGKLEKRTTGRRKSKAPPPAWKSRHSDDSDYDEPTTPRDVTAVVTEAKA
ncbi:hypothetical protein BJ508DRAFT_337038, partial [Ascobolus immersus RN42]